MGNVAIGCLGDAGVWAREADTGIEVERTASQLPLKKRVQEFWQSAPCDSWFTHEPIGTRRFFEEIDQHRYRVHPHLLSAIEFHETRGMRVLEIGCGCGSEAERFARAGASYTGLDLTHAAVALTQKRFRQAELVGSFIQGDAENLPFDDASFDFVYSHGVLHHTPDTAGAVREVHRVLVPGGGAAVMLYHRNSFNYRINVGILRRLRAIALQSEWGLAVMQKLWGESKVQLLRHAQLFRRDPCAYWGRKNMLNRNTDGPDNPLSQVFSKRSARQLFQQFNSVSEEVRFWNPNWLPVVGKVLPKWLEDKLTAHWGWHLWIYATKSERRLGWITVLGQTNETQFSAKGGRTLHRGNHHDSHVVAESNDSGHASDVHGQSYVRESGPLSGTLTFTDSANNSPQTASLTGTGK